MLLDTNQVPRARPAHTSGPTFCAFSPDGKKLVTAGSNSTVRVFATGSDNEPLNIDDTSDSNTALVTSNDFFVLGAEDGQVCKYSLQDYALDRILLRCTLPIRDLALSPDHQWVAVASEELEVKIVHTTDVSRVLYLNNQTKPPKHLTFDYTGTLLTCSCTDGKIYIYDISSAEPTLSKVIDGVIGQLEADEQSSSQVLWHPDGRAFAAPTPTRDVQIVSKRGWDKQRAFMSGHTGNITALVWSPNGAFLVTAATDRTLCLWDTKTQKVLQRLEGLDSSIWTFSWHPTINLLAYTNAEGELFIHTDFVQERYAGLLGQDLQLAPFIHDPLKEIPTNTRPDAKLAISQNQNNLKRRRREYTPDSVEQLDQVLGDGWSDIDGFVEDDDGLGYAEDYPSNVRDRNRLDAEALPDPKRRATAFTWKPHVHPPLQPGSTPWRGNRRYLCLNLIGCVWTIDQDTHYTITVEFNDHEFRRDFHFTDSFGYEKACLSPKGVVFSSPAKDGHQAMLFYRPHETWTTKSDWRSELPHGEQVVAMALGESFVSIATSSGYMRIFTLFGTPVKVYRHKYTSIVGCVSWRDYVFSVGNSGVGADGRCCLTYTIENVRRDETCQNQDTISLPKGASLRTMFFSDKGDPCVYDSTGVLLTLLHWRTMGQAQWIPILDTKSLDRLTNGRKEESYWAVAVANEKFHCIILKGGETDPYFPRPLLSEFDLLVPLHTGARDPEASDGVVAETCRLEELFVRSSVLHGLQEDMVSNTSSTHLQRTELLHRTLEMNKILLQLLAAECLLGEERSMKALEVVKLMKDDSGKMLEAAEKVASRYNRDILVEKIRELSEKKLIGLINNDDVA